MSTLILTHHSDKLFQFDPSRQYDQTVGWKPTGFWVSVPGEDGWEAWCREEQFGFDRLAREYRVTLSNSANILLVDSEEAFHQFTEEYATHSKGIDWAAVAATYDGIVIAPYRGSRRLVDRWYSGWDCASGCVWNLAAVGSIRGKRVIS